MKIAIIKLSSIGDIAHTAFIRHQRHSITLLGNGSVDSIHYQEILKTLKLLIG